MTISQSDLVSPSTDTLIHLCVSVGCVRLTTEATSHILQASLSYLIWILEFEYIMPTSTPRLTLMSLDPYSAAEDFGVGSGNFRSRT